jgi:hypothetical protein
MPGFVHSSERSPICPDAGNILLLQALSALAGPCYAVQWHLDFALDHETAGKVLRGRDITRKD